MHAKITIFIINFVATFDQNGVTASMFGLEQRKNVVSAAMIGLEACAGAQQQQQQQQQQLQAPRPAQTHVLEQLWASLGAVLEQFCSSFAIGVVLQQFGGSFGTVLQQFWP